MFCTSLTRQDAIRELRDRGIKGKGIYFVAAIPLVEMMWADGKVQPAETVLVEEFVKKQADDMNRLAGAQLMTQEDGLAFVRPFLRARPAGSLLHLLTSLVPALDLRTSDRTLNEERKRTILDYCLDIAAAAVTEYPYGAHERFDAAEKACFMDIARVLA
jgi:hypothetical protein